MKRLFWGIGCLVGFLLIALFLATESKTLLQLDHSLLKAFALHANSSGTTVATWIRSTFDFWPSAVWLVALAVTSGYYWGAEPCVEFLILGVGVMFFSRFEKIVFLRGRPEASLQAIPLTGFSFPSAHVLRSTGLIACALAIGWSYQTPAQRKLWTTLGVALILAICLTELLLAANFPSDVVAGALLGSAWALSISALWNIRSQSMADDR